MKSLALASALVLCGPVFANERAESEAKLAALSEKVSAALSTAMPSVEGMACEAADQDPSPTNRLLLPNWQALCRWTEGGGPQETRVILVLSTSLSEFYRDKILALSSAEASPTQHRLYPATDAQAVRTDSGIQAAPSPVFSAAASAPQKALSDQTDTMDNLALALSEMDMSALEALPEVQAHVAALADHRRILEAQRSSLAALLEGIIGGQPIEHSSPANGYEEIQFLGSAPFVQTIVEQEGVHLSVTLTTSSFALEALAEEGIFLASAVSGDVSSRGTYHDRGRIKVYLQEESMTALIDNRAMLVLDVNGEAEGLDPIAAMEAVLARIARNDFTVY